jgi:hypothetical protein
MSKSGQIFTLTQNMTLDFFLYSAFPTQRAFSQSHYAEMSAQGVMPSSMACNHPGLHSIKGQQSNRSSEVRVQDQLLSLPLSASKTLPQSHMPIKITNP